MTDKIGCIAICRAVGGGFIGLNCAKGRGLILPGGRYEPDKDRSWHHAAARELREETGIIIEDFHLKYLWHGPDGNGFQTFAFLAEGAYYCPDVVLPEGKPQVVWPCHLFKSAYAAWYRTLFDVAYDQLIREYDERNAWV